MASPQRPPLQPLPILEALAQHEIEYVAVGSFASILQDADLPLTDIDILPRDESDNPIAKVGG